MVPNMWKSSAKPWFLGVVKIMGMGLPNIAKTRIFKHRKVGFILRVTIVLSPSPIGYAYGEEPWLIRTHFVAYPIYIQVINSH